jgi:hypothetical protein
MKVDAALVALAVAALGLQLWLVLGMGAALASFAMRGHL